jgi:antitoxin component YwqK of YwqJK toxin-antitoxin module
MKKTLILLISLITAFGFSQDINQLDANGKRHGIWKKNFENTKQVRYQGAFNHGKEIGLFKFYKLIRLKSVLTATKQFNNANSIAEVIFLSSTGKTISKGKMNGKKYIGEWLYYHDNKKAIMTTENYNDSGNLHGKKQVFYDNGKVAELANFVDGKLEGESVWYSLKSVTLKVFMYQNDELHGVSKIYNMRGELIIDGQYKRGKKTGIWKYFKNGKLVDEKDFTYIPKYLKKN